MMPQTLVFIGEASSIKQLIVGKHKPEALLTPGSDVMQELSITICLWSVRKIACEGGWSIFWMDRQYSFYVTHWL